MWDCHAHLLAPELRADLPRLLTDAARRGVVTIVAVPETVEESRALLETDIAGEAGEGAPCIVKCVGIHPERAQDEDVDALVALARRAAAAGAIAGIGECGLDFSPHVVGKDETKRDRQRSVFAAQIALACELQLPLNVHSRSAGHHAIAMMRHAGCTRAVLHAFDGKVQYAEAAAREGYFFSIPPCIERSPAFQDLARRLPLSSLLLESDAPALAPVRGAVNEPGNIAVACECIARIRGVAPDDVARATTANAGRLFAQPDTQG